MTENQELLIKFMQQTNARIAALEAQVRALTEKLRANGLHGF